MDRHELRERRERLGLSVGQLARALDVMPTSVYRWESGETPLRGVRAIGVDTVLRQLERRRPDTTDREGAAR
jgi:predicted transcriptional regulator